MPKAEISNQIRKLRFDHDEMTQEQLAQQAGCSRQTIVLLEQGRYVPSLSLALKIARIFDAPVEAVFELAEDA